MKAQMKTVKYGDVSVGDALPPLDIEVTTALIVGGAIASRDFSRVHHDKQVAQDQGMPDVFMNILTTNGLIGRYVTDWAGPDSTLKRLSVKLGSPNVPGMTMTITGKVVAKDDSSHTVEIEIAGKNSWGNHATGSVRVELPVEA